VWDTALLERLGREPHGLAGRLEKRITAEEVLGWQRGTVLQWANEAHGIARAVAYGQLAKGDPAPITEDYRGQAEAAIELQLERAGVRLAWVLDRALK
jgi:hypothetical protein